MYILGIETATTTGGAAIVTEDAVIALSVLNIEVTYSERLMPTIDRVVRDAGLTLPEIGGFAVSIGPGSFTGLRVGLSTVKGLALATGKPVAAVPTLEALAWNLPYSAYPVCPMMDARKSQVYSAIYRFDGSHLLPVMTESALSLDDLTRSVSGPTVFTGEASVLYRAELRALLGERALFAPAACCFPSAATVAQLGLALIKSGLTAEPDALVPHYIRRPEAEVAWEKKNKSE